MFARFLIVLCAFVASSPALALECSVKTPCTFFWTANTESDMAGYRFYVKPAGGQWGSPLNIQHPQTAIGKDLFVTSVGTLAPGDYIAAVSAYDLAGNESGKSNEVAFTFAATDLPPAIPTLQIYVTVP